MQICIQDPDPQGGEGAFPNMPSNASYRTPPFLNCTQRQRTEIDAVVQMIVHQVDLQELAGNFGGPFNHRVTYDRNGCGCGRSHRVVYEFSCAYAPPLVIPGMYVC